MLRRTALPRFACCHPALQQQHHHAAGSTGTCQHHQADTVRADTCFEMKSTHVKYGPGALDEVGRDAKGLFAARRLAIITDATVATLSVFHDMINGVRAAGVDVALYSSVRVEPTDGSFVDCARFLAGAGADCVVSVGGGSVMDTAKAANLLACHPEAQFDVMQFVNPPIGRGLVPTQRLLPHIACPTTCGTGSECTPYAICDITAWHLKTGLAFPALVPTMAVVDPRACFSLPRAVIAASGFDVLCHAVESYTARPYNKRAQTFPGDAGQRVVRPTLNGSNPYADMGCLEALRYLGRSYARAFDGGSGTGDADHHYDAVTEMCLASLIAGTAMGNAGCHLPHAMSYGTSKTKAGSATSSSTYVVPAGYPQSPSPPSCTSGGEHATERIVPHGYAIAVNAPSVFRHIGALDDPELNRRLVRCAQLLQPHKTAAHDFPDAAVGNGAACGEALASTMIDVMRRMQMPNGIGDLGFGCGDVQELAVGCCKQKRLVNNAPFDVTHAHAEALYKGAMKYW